MRYKGELCRRQPAHETYLKHKREAINSSFKIENYKKFELAPQQQVNSIEVSEQILFDRIIFTSGPSIPENPFEDEFVATPEDIAANQLRQDKRIARKLLEGEKLPPPLRRYVRKHAGRITQIERQLQQEIAS